MNGNMNIDQQKRFKELFGKAPNISQQDGFALILDRALRGASEAPQKQAAYILATSYWESALTFLPVREGLAKTDQDARDYVCSLYDQDKIRINYAKPAPNGQAFYGRGYVQLTWEKNYRAIGDHLLGDPELFYQDPDLVMRPDLAAIIMVRGMVDGIFTQHRLSDYINRDKCDYVNARQTVNRMDRAERIADWADKMEYVVGGVRILAC